MHTVPKDGDRAYCGFVITRGLGGNVAPRTEVTPPCEGCARVMTDRERRRAAEEAVALLPHPEWCVDGPNWHTGCAPDELDAQGRLLHRGPTFGVVTLWGFETVATGVIEWTVTVEPRESMRRDLGLDDLRQMGEDIRGALEWAEAHR